MLEREREREIVIYTAVDLSCNDRRGFASSRNQSGNPCSTVSIQGSTTLRAACKHAAVTTQYPMETTGTNAVPKEQSAPAGPRSEVMTVAPSRRSLIAVE